MINRPNEFLDSLVRIGFAGLSPLILTLAKYPLCEIPDCVDPVHAEQKRDPNEFDLRRDWKEDALNERKWINSADFESSGKIYEAYNYPEELDSVARASFPSHLTQLLTQDEIVTHILRTGHSHLVDHVEIVVTDAVPESTWKNYILPRLIGLRSVVIGNYGGILPWGVRKNICKLTTLPKKGYGDSIRANDLYQYRKLRWISCEYIHGLLDYPLDTIICFGTASGDAPQLEIDLDHMSELTIGYAEKIRFLRPISIGTLAIGQLPRQIELIRSVEKLFITSQSINQSLIELAKEVHIDSAVIISDNIKISKYFVHKKWDHWSSRFPNRKFIGVNDTIIAPAGAREVWTEVDCTVHPGQIVYCTPGVQINPPGIPFTIVANI